MKIENEQTYWAYLWTILIFGASITIISIVLIYNHSCNVYAKLGYIQKQEEGSQSAIWVKP